MSDPLRELTPYVFLAGLCPLMPVPFLDDWLLGRVKRRMVREIGRRQGVDLTPDEVAVLSGTGGGFELPGCSAMAVWFFRKVVVKLLVKLFRKVLYLLAAYDGLTAATAAAHEGVLLWEGLEPQRREGRLDARRLRRAVAETVAELAPKPAGMLARTVRGQVGGHFEAARVLLEVKLERVPPTIVG